MPKTAIKNGLFLDLSQIIVKSFIVEEKEVKFKKPFVLAPELSKSRQFIIVRDDHFGIGVIAPTRDSLLRELRAELAMLWRQSRMPDKKLSKIFQEHKKNFLAAIHNK